MVLLFVPMEPSVVVVSKTVQEFLGRRFYLCGYYFQHRGVRLHRTVWQHFHGPIPEGFHVHHIDGDRSNNQRSNLELLEGSNHLSGHMGQAERRNASRSRIGKVQRAAAKWHGSPDGLDWHRDQYERHCRSAVLASYVDGKCSECGKPFHGPKFQKFCHANCKARALRKRRKAGG